MTLNSLSTQCIIAGHITLALSIVKIIIEYGELWVVLRMDSEHKSEYIFRHGWKLAAYVAAAIISILYKIGIAKRRVSLLIPWLLAIFGVIIYAAYVTVRSLLTVRFDYLNFASFGVITFGLEALILYPLFSLIKEIRREKAADKENKQTFVRL